MKLVTYDTGNGPRCGVLQDDQVLDVTVLIGHRRSLRDAQAENCIVGVVKTLTFPAPKAGGMVKVTYPFSLSRVGG